MKNGLRAKRRECGCHILSACHTRGRTHCATSTRVSQVKMRVHAQSLDSFSRRWSLAIRRVCEIPAWFVNRTMCLCEPAMIHIRCACVCVCACLISISWILTANTILLSTKHGFGWDLLCKLNAIYIICLQKSFAIGENKIYDIMRCMKKTQ